ncbi:hypothetical protein PHYBOEH_007882 [Phytophthora boehmeriae]|uniref:Asparagine synthetase domain-containing protein n=1 Tax=Phytophthora boehmeriae TaxID=109152 RepID=A0A8T1W398_9STRA|nr:hypothetical protein PHYBOEH_007882 [Phytophthora boehmeriae]
MLDQRRLCGLLHAALTSKGLDVLIPLSVESYNRYLDEASTSLSRFKLPVPSTTSTVENGQQKSQLLLLVGNSRALWTPLLDFAEKEMEQHDGRVLRDPVDRYVKQAVYDSIQELKAESEVLKQAKVYWVSDTEPGKMILAQKMALAARAVSHCPPSQLCLHPMLGPWVAFRCALVLNVEGGVEVIGDGTRPNEHTSSLLRGKQSLVSQPVECDHDTALHELLTSQMDTAFAQSADAPKNGSIPPDAWRAWALPRLSLAPSHPEMYSPEQTLYHYTKDLRILERAVRARQDNLAVDFIRSPPSSKIIECRRLIQEVLREIRDRFPDGIDAILLSAGLDTSILSEASDQDFSTDDNEEFVAISLAKESDARPILHFRHALTVQADPAAQDSVFAANIFNRLKNVSIEQHHVLRVTLENLLANSSEVARLLCTCDPMELRNSLVIYEALREAAERGVKHLVTGDAADEVFCGYSFYHGMTEEALEQYRERITTTMQFTTAKLAKGLGIEVISPYLDARVVNFSKTLSKSDMVGGRTPVPCDGAQGVHEARCLILIMFGVSSTAIILLAIVETQKTDAQGGEITFWGDANFSGEQRRIRGSLIGQYCYNEDVGEPSSITWKNQSTTGLFGGRAKLAFYTEHDCKGTVRAWFSTEKDFPTNLALDGIDNQIKSFMLWQTSKNPKVLTPY